MSATLVPMTNDRSVTFIVSVDGERDFAFDFPVQFDTDVSVEVALAAAPEAFTYLSYDAGNFTVAGVGTPAGGTVALASPRLRGDRVRISGATEVRRTGSIVRGGRLRSDAIDADLDRLTMIAAEQGRMIGRISPGGALDRTLTVPAGETIDPIPAVATRADGLLGFDASGRPIAVPAALSSAIIAAPGRRLAGLALGQSGMREGRDSHGVLDPIPAGSRFWSGRDGAWVPLAPGAGGVDATSAGLQINRILPTQGRHSLFNFASGLVNTFGFAGVDIVPSWQSGISIDEWVGRRDETTGVPDRTISIGACPMFWWLLRDWRNAFGDRPADVMILDHGQADYSREDYLDERIYLLGRLEEHGIISADTIILHREFVIDPRDRLVDWVQNRVVNFMRWIGRRHQAVVPTAGLRGLDEGLSYAGLPKRLHFDAPENSEIGKRMVDAFGEVLLGRADANPPWTEAVNLRGRPGYVRGHIVTTAGVTRRFDVRNAQGSRLRVNRDPDHPTAVADVTIGDDVWRLGRDYDGATFQVWVDTGARAVVRSALKPVGSFLLQGWDLSARDTLEIDAVGGPVVIDLVFDGTYWRASIVVDRREGVSGGVTWRMVDGLLFASGSVGVSAALASTAAVVFPADMPEIGSSYSVVCSMGCAAKDKTSAGFTIERRLALAVPDGATGWGGVDWQIVAVKPINGAA